MFVLLNFFVPINAIKIKKCKKYKCIKRTKI